MRNPYILTRRQYEECHAGCTIEKEVIPGVFTPTYIYRPTIDRVARGMRINYWPSKNPRAIHTLGLLVEEVDLKGARLLVGHHYGRPTEYYSWVAVADVNVVWWPVQDESYEY